MSRTQARDNSSAVSLFPFLAVLLCTMGGLVVLLVAMSHVSRELAEREKQRAEAQAAAAPVADDRSAEQLAELQQQAEQLRQKAEEAKAAQRDDQLRIAQIEEHVRKLQDEMQLVQAAQRELAADDSQRYDDRAQAERELARLERLIDDSKQEIARMREETDGQSRSYAVVPYQGTSGTRRQPIYIECLANRVVLQPEGIELSPDDFARPLGVGNPLAAALRAARDHMVRNHSATADAEQEIEPYPLVLVRPEGIGAYYRVREAIRSWDADFGYEMIDADWNLEFAPPDPQLATLEQRAIDNARIRREVLASAAPRAFSGGSASFEIPVDEGGPSGGGPYDPSVLGEAPGTGGGDAGATGGTNANSAKAGESPAGPYASDPFNAGGPAGEAGQQQPGAPGRAAEGYAAADANGRPAGAAQRSGGYQSARIGDRVSSRRGGGSGRHATGSGGAKSAGGGQSSQGLGGNAAVAGGSGGKSGGGVESLNKKTGPDDVAIRRTVRVGVFADRLQIGKEPTPLPMPGPTANHIEAFVASVRQQIESWGLAGRGLYWRPVIKLDIHEGGERRAAEIEQVLTRAGVDVEPVQIANLPNREPTSVAW